MNILDKIVANKLKEIEKAKMAKSIRLLEESAYFSKELISLKGNLANAHQPGFITEFKRKSPSKGIINDKVLVEDVTKGYEAAGASAISILTDTEFFGGDATDLAKARPLLTIPVLRKEFILDEYQVIETKAMGADLILLIAACLSPEEIKNLSALAASIGLEVLLEVHNREELESSLCDTIDLVGVNNRNLKDFKVDINYSLELEPYIPQEFIKISESGLNDISAVRTLFDAGFKGFLMGEAFMKESDPALACRNFIEKLKNEG